MLYLQVITYGQTASLPFIFAATSSSKIFAKLAAQFYLDNLQHCTAQLIAISATKSRWRDTVCYGVLDGDGIKPHNKMQTQLCLYNCLELNCFIDPTVYNRLWLLIKIEDKQ